MSITRSCCKRKKITMADGSSHNHYALMINHWGATWRLHLCLFQVTLPPIRRLAPPRAGESSQEHAKREEYAEVLPRINKLVILS